MKPFPFFLFTSLALPGALAADASETPAIELAPVTVTTAHSRVPLRTTLDPKAPAQPVPVQDGAEALRAVPGFSVIRKGGADGDPVLRGMAGSRLAVLIDGEAIYGGCGNRMDPPTAYVFPAAYDRVTVLKGPQSVLHGPGSSAGVVRFERDTVRLTHPGATLFGALTLGDAGRRDLALDVRAGSPDVQARLAATDSRADDYRDGDDRPVHSAYTRWSANASVAWTPDAQTVIELSGARSDGEASYADRTMDGVKFSRENVALRATRRALGPRVAALEAHAYWNYVDHVMDNYSRRPLASNGTPAVSNPDRLTFGARAQVDLLLGAAALALGADAQVNRHTLRTTTNNAVQPFTARPRVQDAEFRQAGVFGEWKASADAPRRTFAGLRLDRWSARDSRAAVSLGMSGSRPNPTANQERTSVLPSGFVRFELDPTPDTTLFAGLGHVGRFPDYWEMFRNESATGLSALALAPERTTQLDFGVQRRTARAEFSLSLFAAAIADFVLVQSGFVKTEPLGPRTAVVSRNIRARTFGGEASALWRVTERWRIDASLAAVRGENETDDRPLAQLPPLEGRVGVTYVASSWSASVLGRAVAAQRRVAPRQGNIVGQDIGPSPGFGLVSVNASWAPRPAWRMSAGIDNLFDRTFAEHISRAGAAVSGFPQTTRVNEPGRFAWLKLDVRL